MTSLPAGETFRLSRGGVPLVAQVYRPSTVRAWAVIVHGFGEHGGRYAPMAAVLAESGIGTVTPDHRGHGRSGGRRGHAERFEEYLEDLDAWIRELREQLSLTTFTAIGHSFGGLLAIAWGLRHSPDLQQVAALSPQLGLRLRIPWFKRLAAAALLPLLPRLALPNGIDARWLSHDEAVVRAYREDPLVHDRVTLRAFHAMQQGMQTTCQQAHEFVLPCLLCVGDEDYLIDVPRCLQWYEAIASGNKRLIRYPGCYHELHHEAAAPELFAALRDAVLGHASG